MRAKRGKLTTSLMLLSAVPLLTFGLIVMLITSKIIYSSLREEVRYSLGVLGTFSYQAFEVLYPGDFEKSGTVLLKGGKSLEGRDELVDDLKETAGVDATLFYGKERYLTTIVGSDGTRAIGTVAETAVTDKVLGAGETYFSDHVLVNGTPYFGYYQPIRNSDHSTVGMMFVGKPRSEVMKRIDTNIFMVFLAAFGMIAIAIGVSYFYSRKVIDLLKKTEMFLGAVAKGDLTAGLEPEILERSDELGEMSRFAVILRDSIESMAGKDALTCLYNRRSCDVVLNSLVEKAGRENGMFSAAIGDIDYFKHINDTYGHQAGDEVLKMVAHAVAEHMEHIGFAFRWGGEEFLMVYEELDREQVFACVEKLRAVIGGSEMDWHGETIKITMTFGIADYGEAGDAKELIRLADARLYSGKSSGRNRTVFCCGKPDGE